MFICFFFFCDLYFWHLSSESDIICGERTKCCYFSLHLRFISEWHHLCLCIDKMVVFDPIFILIHNKPQYRCHLLTNYEREFRFNFLGSKRRLRQGSRKQCARFHNLPWVGLLPINCLLNELEWTIRTSKKYHDDHCRTPFLLLWCSH